MPLGGAMEFNHLTAISPVDGRYAAKTEDLRTVLSEYGLIHYRVQVEIAWFKALAAHDEIVELSPLSPDVVKFLDAIDTGFSHKDALRVKELEAEINHDAKAVEYFLRERFAAHAQLRDCHSFIHFACTSEDINNLAYALMLKDARAAYLLPALESVSADLVEMAGRCAEQAMMGRTHGQAATPTTLGKELSVFVYRLRRQIVSLRSQSLLGKINGATGNFNAHIVAYPKLDWMQLSKDFVISLDLEWNPSTTQIEPHDSIVELLNTLCLINRILIDLCRDVWGYISIGYFRQLSNAAEVGSSTMPHKVNPIDFENAEGNFGMANAVARQLADCLPVSRWQRDLSDSTSLRNLGVVFAHTHIAMQSLRKGLGKLQADGEKMLMELGAAWELLAEPVQTVMRRYGVADAYEQLREMTRGRRIDRDSLHSFIGGLDIPKHAKDALLALTPENYIGNAVAQAKRSGA
ncbi:MAG: adenylosuccinate lyase [Candidatus Eutrophobiaceae bacterium]